MRAAAGGRAGGAGYRCQPEGSGCSLNEFDHLLYEVSNETHPGSTEFQYHVIRFVKRIEAGLPKQHPLGILARAAVRKSS